MNPSEPKDAPEDTAEPKQRAELIKAVSSRLVSGLVLLIVIQVGLFFILRYAGASSTLVAVVGLGAIGSFVSVQRRLNDLAPHELRLLVESRSYVWLAPITGGVLATILYLVFISGLLAGELFPKFGESSTNGATGVATIFGVSSNDPTDYAKLFFWSFVAGYSEIFVTDIIGRFSKKAKGDETKGNTE